ncbi:MAG: hypothetical protein JNK23_00935 [Opitutaceae bacterium]|nr:hypothetical protein [Opitutaceae bacterium]
MIVDAIRELNQKVPFEPYEIRMASGVKHRVPHPDFVLVSPRGNYVIVVDPQDRPHHLSTLLIEEAVVRNVRPRAKAR